MMGCGSSVDTASVLEEPIATQTTTNGNIHRNNIDPDNVVQQFVQLDISISKLEATCPGPRMATVEAWIELLLSERNSLIGLDENIEQFSQTQRQRLLQTNANSDGDEGVVAVIPLTTPPTPPLFAQQQPNGYLRQIGGDDIVRNTPSRDLANLAMKMGVIGDQQKASMHEDFFANLSESAIHLLSVRHCTEIIEHTKVRLKALKESYTELNDLYISHDGILAFISGGTYMTRTEEQLDSQLESARDIREKLGSAMEQWRLCGILLRAASNSSTQCLQLWRHLAKLIDPREKILAAVECRNMLQASLVSLDCAQLALPHVELKHVSNRQIRAVKHCNVYIITDIANLARYEHSTRVFTAYEGNLSKASAWLFETFDKTLRKDFEKAEEAVKGLAKTLRDHREEVFTALRK